MDIKKYNNNNYNNYTSVLLNQLYESLFLHLSLYHMAIKIYSILKKAQANEKGELKTDPMPLVPPVTRAFMPLRDHRLAFPAHRIELHFFIHGLIVIQFLGFGI